MTLGKGLLIGGGVLAGGYILYQLFGSKSATRPSGTPANLTTAGSFVNGLVSLIGGINTSTPSGATGVGSGSSFFTSSDEAAANYNNPNLIATPTGGYSAGAYGNYAYADANPGTPLPAGVYGPPVPATGLVAPAPVGDFTSSSSEVA